MFVEDINGQEMEKLIFINKKDHCFHEFFLLQDLEKSHKS